MLFARAKAAGAEIVLGRLGMGQWFGELPFFDGQPNPCDAVADLDCRVAVLPFARLRALCAREPQVQADLLQVLSMRTRMLMEWMVGAALSPLDARLAALLLGCASPTPVAGQLCLSLRQNQLAAHLGVSRQSVNRLLKQWQAAGWLAISYGALTLVAPAALQAIAEGRRPA